MRSDCSCRLAVVAGALLVGVSVSIAGAQCAPEWTLASTKGPDQIHAGAMAYDAARQRVVLFGGRDCEYSRPGQTWTWDGSSWSLASSTGPVGRVGHAMAYDAARQRVVLFGGVTLNNSGQPEPTGDTWEWDGTSWTRRASGFFLANHAMAYDAPRSQVIAFGGQVGTNLQGNTYAWNGSAWSLVSSSGPSARLNPSMSLDPFLGLVLLYGGDVGCGAELGDTWRFNGTGWTRVSDTGPTARSFCSMASSGPYTLLFGGQHCESPPFAEPTRLGDTWRWAGGAWLPLNIPGPGPRASGMQACYDQARQQLVLYAGEQTQGVCPERETWVLSNSGGPVITTQPSDAFACTIIRLAIDVRADYAQTFQWQAQDNAAPGGWRTLQNGVNIVAGRIVNCELIGGPTLSVNMPGVGGVVTLRCIVANPCGSSTSQTAHVTFCGADFTCDGTVNSGDFFAFLTSFFNARPASDMNSDRVINSQDFFDYLGAFFAGCGT